MQTVLSFRSSSTGREKGEGRREKGEGRREKGEGRREKGEISGQISPVNAARRLINCNKRRRCEALVIFDNYICQEIVVHTYI
ncbi:hypothetical protein DTO207G8_9141 [Paecilomyces variotii]|nr:hypothetical protein DTO207G8_9141 [Paecilomyces variotii]